MAFRKILLKRNLDTAKWKYIPGSQQQGQGDSRIRILNLFKKFFDASILNWFFSLTHDFQIGKYHEVQTAEGLRFTWWENCKDIREVGKLAYLRQTQRLVWIEQIGPNFIDLVSSFQNLYHKTQPLSVSLERREPCCSALISLVKDFFSLLV